MIRIQCGSAVEAFVIPGFSHGGNESGDCVLLDFKNRFFGLADGSGRSPALSRSILMRLSEKLDVPEVFPETCDCSTDGGCLLARRAGTIMEEILGEFYGSGSSTLTGLVMCPVSKGGCGVLVHTGDSVCMRKDSHADGPSRITESNFWLAGRSKKMHTVRPVRMEPDSRFILASDGFMELVERNGVVLDELCSSLDDKARYGEIMDRVYAGGVCSPGHDDAGVVVLHPHMIESFPKRIVMGGVARIETNYPRETHSCRDDVFFEGTPDRFLMIN